MNRYEKHLTDKREKDRTGLYQPHINEFGGWRETLCGACALAAIIQLGRCNHVEDLMRTFIPRYTGGGGGFSSYRGDSLSYLGIPPICGHAEGTQYE